MILSAFLISHQCYQEALRLKEYFTSNSEECLCSRKYPEIRGGEFPLLKNFQGFRTPEYRASWRRKICYFAVLD